jgi:uncharacterized membrane protein
MGTRKNLVWAFIAFGFLGWIVESLLKQQLTYDHMLFNFFGVKLPFLFIYALAGIFLILLENRLRNIPYILRVLMLALIITAYELVSGLIGQLTGYRYWDYSRHPLSIMGYISLYSFLWWLMWMIIFDATYTYARKRAAKGGKNPAKKDN